MAGGGKRRRCRYVEGRHAREPLKQGSDARECITKERCKLVYGLFDQALIANDLLY